MCPKCVLNVPTATRQRDEKTLLGAQNHPDVQNYVPATGTASLTPTTTRTLKYVHAFDVRETRCNFEPEQTPKSNVSKKKKKSLLPKNITMRRTNRLVISHARPEHRTHTMVANVIT